MKKILPFLLVIFLSLPVTSALANTTHYSDGLLDDKLIIKTNGLPVQFFDNTLTTKSSIPSSNQNGIVVFNKPVNIDTIYLNPYGSGALNIVFQFNDGTTTQNFHTTENIAKYHRVDYKNVISVKIYNDSGFNKELYEMELFGIYGEMNPVSNITTDKTHNSVRLSWSNPVDLLFDGVLIKRDGVELTTLSKTVNSYESKNLLPETLYNFEIIANYSDGSKSKPETITVITNGIPIDTQPPKNIFGLSVEKSSDLAVFNYSLPDDEDFSHLMIYRDNVLIEAKYETNSFTDMNLKPNTTYSYKFVSVDTSGNASSGYVQTVVTDLENDNLPPVAPSGLSLTVGNQSGKLTWNKNTENDLKGYNVYVNGVKHNAALLLTNHYIITGLENDSSYSITVTAVDTSGNESVMSLAETLTPIKDSMPIFKNDVDLKAVADGTSNWFLALWPILAFAVGIPLAFYVSNRMKSLFFA